MLPEKETACRGRCGDVGVVCRATTVSRSAAADRLGRQLRRLIVLSGVLVDEYYQCTILCDENGGPRATEAFTVVVQGRSRSIFVDPSVPAVAAAAAR